MTLITLRFKCCLFGARLAWNCHKIMTGAKRFLVFVLKWFLDWNPRQFSNDIFVVCICNISEDSSLMVISSKNLNSCGPNLELISLCSLTDLELHCSISYYGNGICNIWFCFSLNISYYGNGMYYFVAFRISFISFCHDQNPTYDHYYSYTLWFVNVILVEFINYN